MHKRQRTLTRMFALDHGVGVVVSIKFGLTKENVLPPGLYDYVFTCAQT